ncbi:MAG: hypothetical protein LC725_12200 [Lentisphaerae bacterium]|nr:hypothetical protein [Lentisphaerota bacterium]
MIKQPHNRHEMAVRAKQSIRGFDDYAIACEAAAEPEKGRVMWRDNLKKTGVFQRNRMSRRDPYLSVET